jgi:hypothetical protein
VLERMLSTRNCCASARHCSAPTVSWLICCVTSYLLDGTAVLSETDCILYYPASVIQKLRPTHSAGHGFTSRGYTCTRSGTAYAVVLSYRQNEEEFMGRRDRGDRGDEPGGGRHGGHADEPRGERDRQGGGRREDQDRPVDRQERREERQQRREERQDRQERQERRQEHREARQERKEERQQRREERQQESGDAGGGRDAGGGGDPERGSGPR